jgi:hypothetical protein
MFTESEKQIIRKIRIFIKNNNGIYYFWFLYDMKDKAISWEGGLNLPTNSLFRNRFNIIPGKHERAKKTIIG